MERHASDNSVGSSTTPLGQNGSFCNKWRPRQKQGWKGGRVEGWKGGRVEGWAMGMQTQRKGSRCNHRERERGRELHTHARARAQRYSLAFPVITQRKGLRGGGGVAAYSDGALDGFEVNVGGKHGVHDAQQRAYELVVAHVAGSDRVEQCRQHKLHSKSQQEDVIRACVCL